MFYDSTFSLVNLVEEGTWATFKVREEENFFAYFWPIELVKSEMVHPLKPVSTFSQKVYH